MRINMCILFTWIIHIYCVNYSYWRGKKLMVLLSYDVPSVTDFIEKGDRWDSEFLDYLEKNDITYVDFLQKAADGYKAFNISTEEFVDRFYIGRAGAQVFGHYKPYGNFLNISFFVNF